MQIQIIDILILNNKNMRQNLLVFAALQLAILRSNQLSGNAKTAARSASVVGLIYLFAFQDRRDSPPLNVVSVTKKAVGIAKFLADILVDQLRDNPLPFMIEGLGHVLSDSIVGLRKSKVPLTVRSVAQKVLSDISQGKVNRVVKAVGLALFLVQIHRVASYYLTDQSESTDQD